MGPFFMPAGGVERFLCAPPPAPSGTPQEHRNTGTQEHRNTGTQEHRNTGTQEQENDVTENFGSTPEDFDLDDWLSQGSRPQRTVKIYRDWSLMGDLVKLEEQITAVDQEADPSPADISGEELREQYQEIVDKLAGSALEITLRALTNEEVVDVAAGIPEVQHTYSDKDGKEQIRWRPDHVAAGDAVAAEAIVSPKMTREQVRRMREQLGDGPTLVLYETVTELRSAGKVLPAVPFSPARSGDTQE